MQIFLSGKNNQLKQFDIFNQIIDCGYTLTTANFLHVCLESEIRKKKYTRYTQFSIIGWLYGGIHFINMLS